MFLVPVTDSVQVAPPFLLLFLLLPLCAAMWGKKEEELVLSKHERDREKGVCERVTPSSVEIGHRGEKYGPASINNSISHRIDFPTFYDAVGLIGSNASL